MSAEIQDMYVRVRAEIRTEMDKEREVREEKKREEFGTDGDDREGKVLLDFKHFKDIQKYDGDETKWTEWIYNLLVIMGGVSRKVADGMERVLKLMMEKVTEDEVMQNGVDTELNMYKGELSRVLCQLTTGEANTVVRASEDLCGGQKRNGFVALKLMGHRFNAKSPSKLFRTLLELLKPGGIQDVREVAKGIQEWELKMGKMVGEYGEEEKMSNGMKTAVLISMIPKDLQEMVFQMKETNYEEIKERVISVASRKALDLKPKEGKGINEMKFDEECQLCGDEWGGDGQYWDVDALGKGFANRSCHRCGGLGHFARECGTPAGTVDIGKGGKAAQTFGKGGGKGGGGYPPYAGGGGGFGKGGGKGLQGGQGGKGYQGKCYNCDKVGHKSAECWAPRRTQGNGKEEGKGVRGVEVEKTAAAVEVGGVWEVCQVGKELEFPEVGSTRNKARGRGGVGGSGGESPSTSKEIQGNTERCDDWQPAGKRQATRRRWTKLADLEHGGGGTDCGKAGSGSKVRYCSKPGGNVAASTVGGRFSCLAERDREGKTAERLPVSQVNPREEKQHFVRKDKGSEILGDSGATRTTAEALDLYFKDLNTAIWPAKVNPGSSSLIEQMAKEGEKEKEEVLICEVGKEEVMSMVFQVCGVKKALAAVWRMCAKGNRVCFGPKEEDCFVENVVDGRRMYMRKKGGSYVLDVMMNGAVSEITVDSAAEESVCPWEFGEGFGIEEVRRGHEMKLINASGGRIEHHGKRQVTFKAQVF